MITINKSDFNIVLTEDFWPEGILCKIWREYNNEIKINSVSFVRLIPV